MADPLHDNDLKENSLGCVMKSPRFMVTNDLNVRIVTGCWPQKPLPLFSDPQSVKKDTVKGNLGCWRELTLSCSK